MEKLLGVVSLRLGIIALLFLTMFFNTLVLPTLVYSQQSLLKEISIKLLYNPYENVGLITYNVVFVEKITNYTNVKVPILVNNVSDIVVLDEYNRTVMFEYSEGVVEALVNDTSRITITYSVENILQEISLNAYILTINLTIYSNYSFKLQIVLSDRFNVESYPEVNVVYENNLTVINLDQPEEYSIALYKELTITPTTTTPVSTPITQEKTPITTPRETPATSPTLEEAKRREEEARINIVVVAVAVVVLVSALSIAWFLTKKR